MTTRTGMSDPMVDYETMQKLGKMAETGKLKLGNHGGREHPEGLMEAKPRPQKRPVMPAWRKRSCSSPRSRHTPQSVARAAADARRRQFQLPDELRARERAEARARTLAEEMKHRVKNAFTLATSIVSQTFRQAETLEDAREVFTGRLVSMARAQDLIAGDGDDQVDFRSLVEQAVEPYSSGREPQPFHLEGPRILVTGRKATAFAMAFHELATNAAKYGALSANSGQVATRWWVDTTPGSRTLIMEWRESGGPAVQPPQRKGFGSRLIEHALTQDLGGSTELVLYPDGVVCSIRADLSEAEQ